MSIVCRSIVAVLAAGFASAAAPAFASVLYKCAAHDGSVAYTSTKTGFHDCKVISTFADPPTPPAPVVAPKPAETATRKPAVAKGWVYEENTKEPERADFSHVVSEVATVPAEIVRANFLGVLGGVESDAPTLEPVEFPTVLAGVESTAETLGRPLFVAAPYRMPLRPRVVEQPRSAPAVASAVPAGPRVLHGAVYKIARKDGITEYTNIKPSGRAFAVLFTYIATCVACDVHSSIDFAHTALNLDAYRSEIATAAAEYGVDRALLRAVIHAESAFNPLAVSRKGAQGLMQLMPGTAGELGVTDAFDVAQNIRGGARYLAQLLKNFNGNTQLATAAYNAGAGAVQKYGGVPPYDETQVYVQRVETLRDRYRKAL